MTRKLDGLPAIVKVLETMPKARAHWQELAGEDFPLVEKWLRPSGGLAALYPCAPKCGTRIGREIREWRDPIDAVCRSRSPSCPKVELTRDDALAYQVDLRSATDAIAGALGAAPIPPEPTPARRWWVIGNRARGDGTPVPVILSTASVPDQMQRGVADLLVAGLAPFILVLPRVEAFDAQAGAALKRERCEIVVLEEVLGLTPDHALVSRSVEPVAAATTERTAGSVFRRDGDMWTLCFDGRTVHMKHSKGLAYLACLVRSPGKVFEAAELHALVSGVKDPPPPGSGDEDLDERGFEDLRTRLAELEEELDEARDNHDLGRIERLEAEREAIVASLKSAAGLGGRARKTLDQGQRFRKSVSKAITLALDEIGTHHPALAAHLKKNTSLGQTPSYHCDAVVWVA